MNRMPEKVVVSACLIGEKCRYDGEVLSRQEVNSFLKGKEVISVCPEREAGLGVPRNTIQIHGDSGSAIFDGDGEIREVISGRIITDKILGSCDNLAKALDRLDRETTICLLKERSPSCGVHQTHTDRGLLNGRGVFSEQLHRMGFRLISEEDLQGHHD